MLLRDDAYDFATPRRTRSLGAHYDCHQGTFAPHVIDDVERNRVLINNCKIATGDIPQGDACMRSRKTSPEAGIDADNAMDVAELSYHDVPQLSLGFVRPQKIIEARFGWQYQHIAIHHLMRVANQEHIGMQRLRFVAARCCEVSCS
jgi:hypothetical protein